MTRTPRPETPSRGWGEHLFTLCSSSQKAVAGSPPEKSIRQTPVDGRPTVRLTGTSPRAHGPRQQSRELPKPGVVLGRQDTSVGDGASWEDKIPLARGWRRRGPAKAALGSGPAAALPRPFPVPSPSLPPDGAVQRCPAGSLPWAGYTSDTQRAGSSKHPPTGSKDCHGLPKGECPGDPLHTSSVRGLGKCSIAVPSVS